MRRMINISDLAKLLNVSITTLRRWDKMDHSSRNQFPRSFFIGNSKRWDLDEIEKWVNEKGSQVSS